MDPCLVTFRHHSVEHQKVFSLNYEGPSLHYKSDSLSEQIKAHPVLMQESRGFGAFFWKPFIIHNALQTHEAVIYHDCDFKKYPQYLGFVPLAADFAREVLKHNCYFTAKTNVKNRTFTKEEIFFTFEKSLGINYRNSNHYQNQGSCFVASRHPICQNFLYLWATFNLLTYDKTYLLSEKFDPKLQIETFQKNRWDQGIITILDYFHASLQNKPASSPVSPEQARFLQDYPLACLQF